MMRGRKGQAATEYLIILAVVVIIALIVVGVLGGFSGLSGGISQQQSATYWQGAEVGIQPNYRVSTSGAELTVKNNRPFMITINSIKLHGTGSMTPSNLTLAQGASSSVVVDSGVGVGCTAGTPFSYNVTINYSEPSSGRAFGFTGAMPLVGICQ